MEDQMKLLNFPLKPQIDLPSVVNGIGNSETEDNELENDSENESENNEVVEDTRSFLQKYMKAKTTKSKNNPFKLVTLKEAAESALMKNKNILLNVAAQLLFTQKYEEYKTSVPISDQLTLPGFSDPIDLIAIPEVSKIKGHLRGHFIDLTHSGTRLRANATSRDVLMGRASAFRYIAEEGSTALKLTHILDRCDMMSEHICRVII